MQVVSLFARRLPRAAMVKPYSTVIPDLSKTQRFWEQMSVEDSGTGRRVCMTGTPMKTPGGKVLEIPYSKPESLAHLIAQEWRVLSTLKLKNHMIPLTGLAGRSLDITPEERKEATEKLLPYLDTDTLVVLSPHKDCKGELRKAQDALYPHIIEDAKQVWGLPADSINILDTEKNLFGNYQPEATKKTVLKWIESLDNWEFVSLERATTAAKSLIIGMNVVLNRRPILELAMLSSLDVIHQIALWGEVEDTHDVDREDLHRILGAAYINSMRERN